MGVDGIDYTLMMKDIPVLEFNLSKSEYNILDEFHLPFQLKGVLRSGGTVQDIISNYNSVIGYCARRVLSLTRANAKKILNTLRKSQRGDPETNAQIALSCRLLSLQDNYWVRVKGEKLAWEDVDLRRNPLNEVVAQIALLGTSLVLSDGDSDITPELTTHGTYAKCWRRDKYWLYLYKRGNNSDLESKIEVSVSRILDKCNVSHLEYTGGILGGHYCCRCKCMTDDTLSMLHADDFMVYQDRLGKNWYDEAKAIDADTIEKMHIVDYLISNTDRHNMNWGFWYNCDTMEIISCYPLYDHNNAFDIDAMRNDNYKSLVVDGMSMRSVALKAMSNVDFHFTDKITKKDFVKKEHYDSFMKRAEYLSLL